MKEKTEEKNHIHIEEKLQQGGKEHQHSSPPPSSSSPSHEFSFTSSFHPSAQPTIIPAAADDIFSHGHLLPLHHHLPHLPISPRSSTANSLESVTLPIRELSENHNPCNINNANNNNNNYHNQIQSNDGDHIKQQQGSRHNNNKSFSLFGKPKWRNNKCEEESDHSRKKEGNKKKKHTRSIGFEISHVVNKYMRMVIIPLLSLRSSSGRSSSSSRRNIMQQFRNESNSYSFSGHLSLRNINKQDLRGGGRRREFSAPASIRTSPTNSGLLATAETVSACSSSDHSTMEELQSAIQAAIAHCKNSVMAAYKLKCQD